MCIESVYNCSLRKWYSWVSYLHGCHLLKVVFIIHMGEKIMYLIFQLVEESKRENKSFSVYASWSPENRPTCLPNDFKLVIPC